LKNALNRTSRASFGTALMRRLLLALLFPLLLISQQAAFVHSLEHLPSSAGASKWKTDGHGSGDQYCEKCFEFAQIGAAADLPAALAVLGQVGFEAIGFRLPIAPLSEVLAPRSRGPPRFL
jgi:hypothetical protein